MISKRLCFILAFVFSFASAGYDMKTVNETLPWGWVSIQPSPTTEYALSGQYGTRETSLKEAEPVDILYISMLLSGEVIPDRAHILYYIQIPFPDKPGRYESFTCNIEYRQDVTETNPTLGGYIVVRNYDGKMSFKEGSKDLRR